MGNEQCADLGIITHLLPSFALCTTNVAEQFDTSEDMPMVSVQQLI